MLTRGSIPMGASGWTYFVPYQSDISEALQMLHDHVFQQRAFLQHKPYWRSLSFEDFLPPDPAFTREDIEAYRAEYERLQALPEPTTIDTLREWQGQDGTHSILDIVGISDKPTFQHMSPLTADELIAMFDTLEPTQHMVEVALADPYHDLHDARKRWEGVYIILYQDDQPHQICFTGFSGD
jgi:hypothetical protein